MFAVDPSEAASSCGACRLPRPGDEVAGELLEEVTGTAAMWYPLQRQGELSLATYAAPSWFSVLGNTGEL